MAQPKLYQLLASLENQELHWLGKFLASPFHNTNEVLLQLFKWLRAHHPHFQDCPLEAVFKHFFPGESFQAKWVNDRFSELSRCVYHYLTLREFQEDAPLRGQLFRRALGKRGFSRTLSKKIEQQLAEWQVLPIKDHRSLRWKRDLRLEQFYLPEYRPPDESRQIVDDIQALTELEYHHNRIHFAVELLSRGKTYDEQTTRLFTESEWDIMVQSATQDPVLAVYVQLFELYRQERSPSDYGPLIARYLQLFPELNPEVASFLLIKLCSLGIGWVNRGHTEYAEHIFPLYELGVEEGFFNQYGRFPEATFMNICSICAFSGKRSWAEEFIRQQVPRLASKEVDNTIALGRAILAFYDRDFSQVVELLNQVKSRRLDYTLRMHSLHVRCLLCMYLEDLTLEPVLLARLRNFHQFLKRTHLQSSDWKQGYFHFLLFVKQIIHLRKTNWEDYSAHQVLGERIANTRPLSLKKWLLEQLKSHSGSNLK